MKKGIFAASQTKYTSGYDEDSKYTLIFTLPEALNAQSDAKGILDEIGSFIEICSTECFSSAL